MPHSRLSGFRGAMPQNQGVSSAPKQTKADRRAEARAAQLATFKKKQAAEKRNRFVVLGLRIIQVFAQMDRDPLMSRLSETSPNRLGLNFVYRMLSYGALPLLTLLASLVPDIGNFLQSWLQPALQSLK